MAQAAVMAAVTAVLAQVAIPLPGTPVPVTLQVLGVLLTGLVLPPRQALVSMAVYVALGAVGLPVFAGGRGGWQSLVGPTGGYLWGFILAAGLVAALRGPGGIRDWLAALAGVACIYLLGAVQLQAVTGWSWERVLVAGVLPFVPWDAVKGIIAAAAAPRLRRALGQAAAGAAGPAAPVPPPAAP